LLKLGLELQSNCFAIIKTKEIISNEMKIKDQYHKWIEWSEENQIYIGKCPDLITGIHGDNPTQLYSELCEVVEDVIQHFVKESRELPPPQIRPMQEVV
jgi:hypothetical protein